MTWFKVDDKLWGHPKWLATPTRARGLWVTAGSWSADQKQDGRVPTHVLPSLGATKNDAAALVSSGLWLATDTGWLFHGWAEFQPTKAQQDADREAAKERMRQVRAARQIEKDKRARSEDVRPNNSDVRPKFGRSSENVRLTPTRPDPTRPDPLLGLLRAVGWDDEISSSSSPDVSRETGNG